MAPDTYVFPSEIRDEKIFCACIPWASLKKCAKFSLYNTERLVEDAEFLLKRKRLSSSNILAVFALEEVGKACFSLQYFAEKKNVLVNGWKKQTDYCKYFLSHEAKIGKALSIVRSPAKLEFSRMLYGKPYERELQTRRLESAYIGFDGKFGFWGMPRSKDHRMLLSPPTISYRDAKKVVEASCEIGSLVIEKELIETAKEGIKLVRSKFESLTKGSNEDANR
jgi:AbiV family abortive infection protein